MTSAISSPLVRSPYACPVAPARRAAPPELHEPDLDVSSVVILPAAAAEPEATSTSRSWLAAGALALALAAPALAGAATLAQAPAPATSISLPNNAQPRSESQEPVTAAQLERMKQAAAPSAFDNSTARTVRGDYAARVREAADESRAFAEIAGRLEDVGTSLDAWLERGVGTYSTDAGAQVTVHVEPGATRVELDAPGLHQESYRDAESRLVLVRENGQEQTLQETATRRSVSSGTRVRTAHRDGSRGYLDGDFEVLDRRMSGRYHNLLVRDASIFAESRLTVHGFAGDIRVETRERFEIPRFSIQVYPNTQLKASRFTYSFDLTTGEESYRKDEVEVRSDGSTRQRTNDDGFRQDIEQPGEAPGKDVPQILRGSPG